MEATNKNNAPRVENESVNVVINFASDENREAEARALKSREAEAADATKARENAAALMKSARDNFNALRDREYLANYNAARSRFAAGSDNAADRALLSCDALSVFSRSIYAAAAEKRAALEATPEAKAATKAIREESRKTGLFRALRDLGELLPQYNAKFAVFGFQLEADELTPLLMKADNVTPFLLAPTADGAKVATLRRGKLSVISDWSAPRVADILIDNALISAAVEAAPRAAILEAINARDNVATLQSEADEIAATLKARRDRAAGLQRTIKNPRAAAATKARAAADLEALNAEISTYNAKHAKALEALRDAKAKAAALRAAALEAAEIAPADLAKVEALRDAFNVAKAAEADATRDAQREIARAASIAAAALRKQKKTAKFDALKKADPAAVFAAAPADEIAAALAILRNNAPAEAEAAEKATRNAEAKREALREAAAAEAAAIISGAKADPAAKYRALLEIACNALKAARDAKAKKEKAADVEKTPEISDREFIEISEAADNAEATAAAALEALNAEKPADVLEAAREARNAQRQPRQRSRKPAEAAAA